MYRCKCTTRSLEILVRDFAGLNIKQQCRNYRTRPRPSTKDPRRSRSPARPLVRRTSIKPRAKVLEPLPPTSTYARKLRKERRIGEGTYVKASTIRSQHVAPSGTRLELPAIGQNLTVQSRSVLGKNARKRARRREEGVLRSQKPDQAKKRKVKEVEVKDISEEENFVDDGPSWAALKASGLPEQMRKAHWKATTTPEQRAKTFGRAKRAEFRRSQEATAQDAKAQEAKAQEAKAQDARAQKASDSKDATKYKGSDQKDLMKSNRTNEPEKKEIKRKELWQVQKAALDRKFGQQGWQPRKRVSPDTLEGIRALHASDPNTYNTETLANHFAITPEAIRRILKSKWKPKPEEIEDRMKRWEKRGVKKWEDMAAQGMKPPKRWREMGVENPDLKKKVLRKPYAKEEKEERRKKQWQEIDALADRLPMEGSFADRIM